jgi:hypothetical protein
MKMVGLDSGIVFDPVASGKWRVTRKESDRCLVAINKKKISV